MSHILYKICRHRTYYYNRRLPKHAVDLYSSFIRYGPSSVPVVARTYAKRLSEVLETSWQSKHSVSFINIPAVLDSFIPRFFSLSEVTAEYIVLKNILSKPTEIAMSNIDWIGG